MQKLLGKRVLLTGDCNVTENPLFEDAGSADAAGATPVPSQFNLPVPPRRCACSDINVPPARFDPGAYSKHDQVQVGILQNPPHCRMLCLACSPEPRPHNLHWVPVGDSTASVASCGAFRRRLNR
jgi:hypothetical protein